MTMQDSVGVYDQAEFADNPEARCSIVLILDVSGSMGGLKIQTVNQALTKFRDIIQEDSVTALRADVAVIEFDHEARVVVDFTNGTDFEPPVLAVKGGTNYSKAVNLALDITEARKQSYRDGGIAYYRSLAYFLTDGYPEHDDAGALSRAAARVSEMEQNRSVAFFCFGIGTPDLPADMSELAKLAPRQPVELTNMEQLDGSIQWLSRSVAAVSQSQPGDSLRLPEPDYLDF
ncbi:MAG: VWA domain-containing protein [Chloroflexota bacterium]|nr:VWA domain-containing protein [Chloroflexota bacterium]MDE2960893.1 VWA domain-containing protein [Chloroflexota bacterium]